jgi:antitoxin (DNA-binding transcriptional repressor) of toxin-antitoxin stability system
MNTIHFKRVFALAALLALAAFAQFSCDENPSDNTSNYHITAYSGNNQTERVGAMLADPLVVRATDLLNNAKAGVEVEFSTRGTPSAEVTPRFATTDANGLASCRLTLGATAGTQHVWVRAEADSTVLSATAVAVACDEESPERVCQWPAGHIFIATTSSSLLSGAGSVVIDFDPDSGNIAKVLETADFADGISFSSRGELFVSTLDKIRKVDHATFELTSYLNTEPSLYRFAMEPNPGGVLVALINEAPQMIGCPGTLRALSSAHTFSNILWENLAVDPVTRDIYMMTGSSPTSYVLWHMYWDGVLEYVQRFEAAASLSVGAAEPRGMCADSSGTIYICFDGNDNWRRIVSVSAEGTIDYSFFDFYEYYGRNSQEAGRWGDLAYLEGKLYVIDRRNDRLVIISKHGTWLGEVKNTIFSRPLDESDHYAICASPTWLCQTR